MRTVRFTVSSEDPHSARLGRLTTPHGEVDTPTFMPVGTAGAVKAMLPDEVENTGAQIILGNTFHLLLRPGHKLVERLGGLHRFGGWSKSILTDSGGFQVFSFGKGAKISEEGVKFRSPYDGALVNLTPELSIEVQEALGTDIAMAFDECPPGGSDAAYVKVSMDRTTRWLDRCISARRQAERTSLFGIVQGGVHEALRREHAAVVMERDLDGYALGGVAVGEGTKAIQDQVALGGELLPRERPRYLMGVGLPADLVRAVLAGFDMFDCVIPTRNARNGRLFTSQGILVLKNAKHRESDAPIDPECACPTCETFTLAYLRHLFTIDEILVHRLTTMHNLWFFQAHMREIRRRIESGDLASLLREPCCQVHR